jgi:hypothetical protein
VLLWDASSVIPWRSVSATVHDHVALSLQDDQPDTRPPPPHLLQRGTAPRDAQTLLSSWKAAQPS